MQFHINEGVFTLPSGVQDNSMNMLMTGHSGLDLSLIMTRDRLEPGESFEAFIERQIKAVSLQVSDYQIAERHTQKAPDSTEPVAVELAQQFTQNGQTIYQRQRTWLLPDRARVLVLTAASVVPINDAQMKQWLSICASFQPRS
jgi:hypothetical protein